MIKVEAIQDFTLERFNEVKNLQRGTAKNQEGWIYKTDIFECEKELADYLLGKNPLNRPVVKVIEVIPEKVEIKEEPKEEKVIEEQLKTTKKKNTKKSSKK